MKLINEREISDCVNDGGIGRQEIARTDKGRGVVAAKTVMTMKANDVAIAKVIGSLP